MDLNLFFDPLLDVETESFPESSFFASIYANIELMPDLEDMDMALIGLREYRGGNQREGYGHAANAVRRQLYQLKRGQGAHRIVDLGNFRNGPKAADTILRLKEVCTFLMQRKILPILIGGTHDLDLGPYYAYESMDKLVTLLGVDNRLDFDESGQANEAHLAAMFRHDPNYLFTYVHLGHQSYLNHHKKTALMERMSFEAIRLGMVKENLKEMEPVVREADMVSFDVSALQVQYAPGATDTKVYGLTGEEACQLCWYAGLSDKLSTIGFYEFDADKDSEDARTAFVLATMIWYFIEGFHNRKGDKNFMSNDYLSYEVAMPGKPEFIRFFKSKRSEKWWMEVPHENDQGLFNRNRMIACSYSDYELALTGEIPSRWVSYLQKS